MRFDTICEAHDREPRPTKPNHPWTHGQVERMVRTIQDAAENRAHDDSHDQRPPHLKDAMADDDFARRLKTVNGLTPDEYACKI